MKKFLTTLALVLALATASNSQPFSFKLDPTTRKASPICIGLTHPENVIRIILTNSSVNDLMVNNCYLSQKGNATTACFRGIGLYKAGANPNDFKNNLGNAGSAPGVLGFNGYRLKANKSDTFDLYILYIDGCPGSKFQIQVDSIIAWNIDWTIEYGDRKHTALGNVMTITNCSANGIESAKSIENDFRIYPNPVSTVLTLEGGLYGEIEIFNSFGQLVYKASKDAQVEKVDVSTFPKGIYYLQIGNQKIKFVK